MDSEVFVVVTGDYFGGADNSDGNLIKVFKTRDLAVKYQKQLEDGYGIETMILKCQLMPS